VARFEAAFKRIVLALAVLAGAILSVIALAIPVDVTLRACCSAAIFGLGDLTEHGIAAATFLGAPWVLMRNGHVAVDIVINNLPLRARARLAVLVNVVGAAVSAIFAFYMGTALSIALGRGSIAVGIIAVPEWLTFVAPTISLALFAIGFLLRIGRDRQARQVQGL